MNYVEILDVSNEFLKSGIRWNELYFTWSFLVKYRLNIAQMKAPMYIGTSPWGSNFNIDLNKKSFKKKFLWTRYGMQL
jgi:hypothetical protein